MLDPRDRQLLLESLRPPEGYRLDRAIGTSYSLDLIALLTAPLAFTFFNWEDNEGKPAADPLALLESIRRHADRIRIFCQAGEIKLPPPSQRLIAYLEKCVIPVMAPRKGGIFHPKVWLLRFVKEEAPVAYRLVCATSNLTFDKSWDTVLTLDGVLAERTNAIAVNKPLGEFFEALASMRGVAEGDAGWMKQMAEEVRRVKFEPPAPFDTYTFVPMGYERRPRGNFIEQRPEGPLLIISPFLSTGFLRTVTEGRSRCILISRPDEIAGMPKDVLARFKKVYCLDPATEEQEGEAEPDALSWNADGLHAKLFIEEDGWNAHVYTGSANATDAAVHLNVEFMTHLSGTKGKAGIDRLLGDGKQGLSRVLVEWSGEVREASEEEKLRKTLEKELAAARREFASRTFLLNCVSGSQADTFILELRAKEPIPTEVSAGLVCWPTSLRRDAAKSPTGGPGVVATFGPVSMDAITGFIACEMSVSRDGIRVPATFVINVPVEGAPEDRLQRLLAQQLKDRDKLLRLLWLLLQAETSASDLANEAIVEGEGEGRGWGSDEFPIFELLVKSLADSAERVNEISRLVDDLARSPEGRNLVPASLTQFLAEAKSVLGARHAGA